MTQKEFDLKDVPQHIDPAFYALLKIRELYEKYGVRSSDEDKETHHEKG